MHPDASELRDALIVAASLLAMQGFCKLSAHLHIDACREADPFVHVHAGSGNAACLAALPAAARRLFALSLHVLLPGHHASLRDLLQRPASAAYALMGLHRPLACYSLRQKRQVNPEAAETVK